MTLPALRGIASVTAAATGFLLFYGVVYAMEGITTRIPMNPVRELGMSTLWTLPLIVLFCSGLNDFCAATKQAWVFWLGLIPALALLYYFERNTSSSILTKTAMPPLATAAGLIPHIFRRIRFVFTVFCFAAGISGLAVFYFVLTSYLSGSSFATKSLEFVVLAFGTASLVTGVLSVGLLKRHRNPLAQANG
jgi:hypothetical protein